MNVTRAMKPMGAAPSISKPHAQADMSDSLLSVENPNTQAKHELLNF